MLEYFAFKKAKRHHATREKSQQPVLNDEDQAFLSRITSEAVESPPPLPARPHDWLVGESSLQNDRQIVLANDAEDVPLPDTPNPVAVEKQPGNDVDGGSKTAKGKGKADRKSRWSFLQRDRKTSQRNSTNDHTANDSSGPKSPGQAGAASPTSPGQTNSQEMEKEDEELTNVLDKLNLAAENNRVFSMSDESRELLRKFTLVFKDLVNGAPTAYHDLESLLKNSEGQLQKIHDSLPSFLKQLIEKLPEKFTTSLGPEALAAAAEKPSLKSNLLGKGASAASKAGIKVKVPSLKDLVTKKGALVGMLRAIVGFLRTRFPAVMGLNVLWSIALFILLLVCWYCHKRGREVRLEKERAVTEAEMAAIKAQVEADPPAEYEAPIMTTAPEGAPLDQVREGISSAEQLPGPGNARADEAPTGM